MIGLTTEQAAEIESIRATPSSTLRPVSPGLEEILHKSFPVLDHGIIRVVDYMGDDSAIVQAARVSYGRGTKRIQEDSGLIKYLLRHLHTTPFEMAEIKFHVKLPIFVARQWIRHRMASVNEYSARYSVLDNEFYIPQPEHLAAQSTLNRQGRGAVLEGDEAAEVISLLRRDAEQAYDDYSTMLNDPGSPDHRDDRSGLARELARMNLSLNFYTQWYWKTDLHNLMNFLRLRADSHAQFEIRAYAEIMLEIMAAWVPIAHSAFKEYRMEAVQLSGTAVKAVRRMIAGEAVSQENSGLSAREWQELSAALDLPSLKAS
ncbi:thymidylate synthase, flavin-dependent (plasmid) [Rhizobium leguminosarum bv. trifolii WSM2304]|uniref:Flavin-dependent thymidylate synthase n=1 Tax=Rhizobium leguminosarum bv. trifolii (strain WSM2304) TaxID=395492 RepID=A0ABF7QUS6_RHILW|nr:thymidylate synthase, flavin-dependent [Rhizobium leguminosarum bv. trifolii WSM2304]